MKEQEQALTTATNNRTQIMNEVDTINHKYFDTMDELDAAQKNYDNLQKIVDNLNKGVDTAELTQLKTELANLQSKQTELETTVADLTKQLKEAENGLSDAYVKYNDNVVNFYKEIYRETGSADAYAAFTELEKYDGKTYTENGVTATIYDSKNYDQTIASLADLKEAINYIKIANAIREYEGQTPFKISYYLMAVSAIQNEYSSVKINHSEIYNVAENLAYETRKRDSNEYFEENGKFDVEKLDKFGRGELKLEGDEWLKYINNPFTGLWIEEKVDFEQNKNYANDGHYLTLVDPINTLTGFSVNTEQRNGYYVFGQVFASDKYYYVKDENGNQQHIDGVTVDEFEKLLNAWILKKANGIQLEQGNIDNIKEKLEVAQSKLDAKKEEVAQKQDEINNYVENINSQYQEAKETLDQTQQKFDNISQQKAEKQKELTQANQDVNDAVQELSKANQKYRQIIDEKSHLETDVNDNQTRLSYFQYQYDTLTKQKKEIQKQIDEKQAETEKTQSSIDEKQQAIDNIDELIAENQKEVDDYNVELSTLRNEVSAKTTEKDQATSKINDLTKETESYNKSLQDYETAKENFEKASKTLDEAKKSFEQTQKELDVLESKIEKTVSQLNTANKEKDKVQNAQAQWDAIKSGTSAEYGPFDDTALDELKDTVDTYIQTKGASIPLEEELTKALNEFDLADKKAEEASEAYEKAKAEYDEVKSQLDAFNEKHGVVTVDTIVMPTQAEYTGVQIIPGVFVKDTKGNQVDPSEYTITYGENVEIGTGTVTITMNGKNYVGTFTKTFKIVDKNTDNKKDDNSDNSGNSGNTGENGGNTSGSATDSSNSSSSNNSANASSDNNKESTKNTENTVKTGDSSKDVAQLGAMSVISLLFMSLLKRKEDKNKVSE